MRKILATLFVLLLACSAVAEEASGFTFRNGIAWGMSQQEVLEAEGNPKYETEDDDDTRMIEIEDVEFGGVKCDVEYAFIDDMLFMATVEYDADEVSQSFDDVKAKLVERYGEPGEFNDEIRSELGDDALEELDTIVSWTLSDGTDVMLLENADDNDITIVFLSLDL